MAEITYSTYRRVFENVHVTIPWDQLDKTVKDVWIKSTTQSMKTYVEKHKEKENLESSNEAAQRLDN